MINYADSEIEKSIPKITAKRILGKGIIYAVLIFILFGIDQYTKRLAVIHLKDGKDFVLIKNILSFSYLENTGAAWGVLSGKITLFAAFTCILIVLIILIILRLERMAGVKYRMLQLDMAGLLAGAVGNLADRLINGYVVDFIKIDFINFPVFNVADCYVTLSMIILIIFLLFFMKEDELDNIFYLKRKK